MASTLGQRQTVFVASAFDLSSDTLVEFPNLDILGRPFELKRIYLVVTTDLATNPAVVDVGWRPNEGSATGAVDFGQFTVPVTADALDEFHADFLERAPSAATSILSAGGSGGIAGSERFEGRESIIAGPGGALTIDSDGGPSAGNADIWAEVLVHSFAGDPVSDVTELTVTS